MSGHDKDKKALLAPALEAQYTQDIGSVNGPDSGGMASFFEVAAVLDAGVLPGLANMSDDTNGTMQTSLALFAKMVAARSPDDPRSMNHPRSMRSVMIGNPLRRASARVLPRPRLSFPICVSALVCLYSAFFAYCLPVLCAVGESSMAGFGVLNEFYSNFLFKQQGDTASQLAEKPSSSVYNNNDVDEFFLF